jgi:hypothetical protein
MDHTAQSVDQAGASYPASLLDWDPDCDLSEINSPTIVQAISALGGGPGDLPLVSHAFTTNGPILDGMDTMVPRTFIHIGQIPASVIDVTQQELVLRPHYGNEVHAEGTQEERAYTHDSGAPKTHNHEWEIWKPEIEKLYLRQNLTLPEVTAAMERKGFIAT